MSKHIKHLDIAQRTITKPLRLLGLLSLTLIQLSFLNPSKASTWPLPIPCPVEDINVEVKNLNPGKEEVLLNFKMPPYENQDQVIELNKGRSLIQMGKYTDRIEQINLKTENENGWDFTVRCKKTNAIFPLKAFQDRVYQFNLNLSSNLTLSLMDLGDNYQSVELIWKSKLDAIIKKETYEIADRRRMKQIKLTPPTQAYLLEIRGEQRLAAWLHNLMGQNIDSKAVIEKASIDSNKVYFLVGPKNANNELDGEAFTIALEDMDLINQARQILSNPSQEKIILAGIKKGTRTYNRAWHQKSKAPYSWFVHRVDGFTDFAHISCDGSPEIIEDNLELKIEQGSRICFWRYRLIKELKPDEITEGQLKSK